jgi:acyl carrier protein
VSHREGVPIGYPVTGTTVALLNPDGEEVGVYGIGEIVIQNPHVALGYWRQPELTRAAFQGDEDDPRERAYRTGDLGRRLPDGSIVFAGRKDSQVKLRGYRIEIGEIEAALLAHPAIREAVVVIREDVIGEPRLAAYVVPPPGEDVQVGQLHRFLKERLPSYMLPATFVALSRLPLTSTGKVDRRGLPAAPPPRRDLDATLVVPRTPLEQALAALWAELLGLDRVGVTDDFFELGGHSLLLMRVLSRVRDRFSVELPLRRMFEGPTVAQLAEAVADAQGKTGPAAPIRPQRRQQYRRTLPEEP